MSAQTSRLTSADLARVLDRAERRWFSTDLRQLIEAIRAAQEKRPIPGEDELSDETVRVLNAMLRLAVNAPSNRLARRQQAARRRGRR